MPSRYKSTREVRETAAHTRKCKWHLRAACAGLVLIAAGVVPLSACSEASSGYDYETATHHEPAKLEPIKGTGRPARFIRRRSGRASRPPGRPRYARTGGKRLCLTLP